jgi:hypothetical protein
MPNELNAVLGFLNQSLDRKEAKDQREFQNTLALQRMVKSNKQTEIANMVNLQNVLGKLTADHQSSIDSLNLTSENIGNLTGDVTQILGNVELSYTEKYSQGFEAINKAKNKITQFADSKRNLANRFAIASQNDGQAGFSSEDQEYFDSQGVGGGLTEQESIWMQQFIDTDTATSADRTKAINVNMETTVKSMIADNLVNNVKDPIVSAYNAMQANPDLSAKEKEIGAANFSSYLVAKDQNKTRDEKALQKTIDAEIKANEELLESDLQMRRDGIRKSYKQIAFESDLTPITKDSDINIESIQNLDDELIKRLNNIVIGDKFSSLDSEFVELVKFASKSGSEIEKRDRITAAINYLAENPTQVEKMDFALFGKGNPNDEQGSFLTRAIELRNLMTTYFDEQKTRRIDKENFTGELGDLEVFGSQAIDINADIPISIDQPSPDVQDSVTDDIQLSEVVSDTRLGYGVIKNEKDITQVFNDFISGGITRAKMDSLFDTDTVNKLSIVKRKGGGKGKFQTSSTVNPKEFTLQELIDVESLKYENATFYAKDLLVGKSTIQDFKIKVRSRRNKIRAILAKFNSSGLSFDQFIVNNEADYKKLIEIMTKADKKETK